MSEFSAEHVPNPAANQIMTHTLGFAVGDTEKKSEPAAQIHDHRCQKTNCDPEEQYIPLHMISFQLERR